MEDMTGRWAKLSLNNRESQRVELAPDHIDNTTKTLIAKFLTKQRTNMEVINRTLRSMWRAGGSFEVRDLGDNTVLILFEDEADVVRILMQGPWSFDRYLIGLYRPGEETTVDDASFDWTSFWVQIHGLQLRSMRKENAEAIGCTLRRVECVEESGTGDCRGRCMRVPCASYHYVGAAW